MQYVACLHIVPVAWVNCEKQLVKTVWPFSVSLSLSLSVLLLLLLPILLVLILLLLCPIQRLVPASAAGTTVQKIARPRLLCAVCPMLPLLPLALLVYQGRKNVAHTSLPLFLSCFLLSLPLSLHPPSPPLWCGQTCWGRTSGGTRASTCGLVCGLANLKKVALALQGSKNKFPRTHLGDKLRL